MTTDALAGRARSKRRKPPPPMMIAALILVVLIVAASVRTIMRIPDDGTAERVVDLLFLGLDAWWLTRWWARLIEEWERWRDGDA